MTTIAAATMNGVHALAADGQSMAGSEILTARLTKLIKVGDALVGAAGNGQTLDLLKALDSSSGESVEAFAQSIRKAMNAAEYKKDDSDNGAPNYHQSFLYLSDRGVWEVFSSLGSQIVETDFPTGIGSGCEYAVGAMESMSKCYAEFYVGDPMRRPSARDLVLHAVEVAMKRDAGTGGKIMLALRGAETFGPGRVTS